MAMSNSTLIGLMTLGFLILMWGKGFWWVGVCLLLFSTVMAFGSGESPAGGPTGNRPGIGAVGRSQPAFAGPGKDEEDFDVHDMKWSPTTFADGMMGVNPMAGELGGAVGARSGAFTQDMGPIRFKDDIRFRISAMEGAEEKAFDMARGEAGPLTAWDFRTRKDAFAGLHVGSVKTVESPDTFTNPGLGSPNEWIAEWMKKNQQK